MVYVLLDVELNGGRLSEARRLAQAAMAPLRDAVRDLLTT